MGARLLHSATDAIIVPARSLFGVNAIMELVKSPFLDKKMYVHVKNCKQRTKLDHIFFGNYATLD